MAIELDLLLENAENMFYSEDTNEFDLKSTGQELLDRTKLLKETLQTCITSLRKGAHRDSEEIIEIIANASGALS